MIWKLVSSIAMGVFLTTGFFGLDNMLAREEKFYDISLPLDEKISLWPAWIWVYLLYYPFCFLPLLFPGVLENTGLFLRISEGFLCQFAVAWCVFYCFPTRIVHSEVPGTSLSIYALRGLYAVDPGYNVCPSLHVANVFYVSCVATQFLPLSWCLSLFFLSGMIALSTLYIKQHLFLDVPTGFLLGLSAYIMVVSGDGFRGGVRDLQLQIGLVIIALVAVSSTSVVRLFTQRARTLDKKRPEFSS